MCCVAIVCGSAAKIMRSEEIRLFTRIAHAVKKIVVMEALKLG
jgi:hypothetical protein